MKKARKPIIHHLHDYFLPHKHNSHSPHIFSVISVVALIFVVIVFEIGYLVQTKFVFFNTNFLAAVLPTVLVDLTNQSRVAYGITPVAHDTLLDIAAQAAANDMAAKGYFAHVSPDGKTPWFWLNQAGYHYSYAGENLAVNFTDSQNVETAWMESPTHRANIVKPQYTRVGFGTANGMYEGKETTFVVEFFATPEVSEMAIASPSEVKPTQEVKGSLISTSSIKVLGSQTQIAPAPTIPGMPLPVTTHTSPGMFVSLLAAPLSTIETILTILFAIIASFLVIAVLARGKVQHPSVIIGGTLLLTIIGISMLLSSGLASNIQLTPGTQTAGVGALFSN